MPKRRSRRRSRVRRARARRVGFFVLVCAAVLTILGLATFVERNDHYREQLGRATLPADARPLLEAAATDDGRPVYPYSIIAGGVSSIEDLKKAIDADPVVAAHYAGFDLSQARIERLSAPKTAHVAYRVNNDVFWTRRPVVLRAGETVVTDGTNIARTRCGNLLAADPPATSPLEPPAAVLDNPLTPAKASTLSAQGPSLPGASPGLVAGPPAGPTYPGAVSGPIPVGGFAAASGGSPGTGGPGSSAASGPVGVGSNGAPSSPAGPGSNPAAGGGSSGTSGPPAHIPAGPPSSPAIGGSPGGPVLPMPGDDPIVLPPPELNVGPVEQGGPTDPSDQGGSEELRGPVEDSVPAVPEPGTTLLLLCGAAAFAANRLRMRRRLPGA